MILTKFEFFILDYSQDVPGGRKQHLQHRDPEAENPIISSLNRPLKTNNSNWNKLHSILCLN